MRYYFGSAMAAILLATAAAQDEVTAASITEDAAMEALAQGHTCCDALSLFLGKKVALPVTPAYEASIESYWSNLAREVGPSCIVTPDKKEDVSIALVILSVGGKFLPNCDFAVRSGGHTPFAGANNIDGGVTIDLQKLNQVKVSPDRKTAQIGPGNRWLDVYSALDKQGLATSGGRVATVGVGGLITGGGVSFFSPRFGYVADNVEDFEVVLAGGRIAHANAKRNKDLWVALRGGSNNFGIVTSFTMRAFEPGNLWGGFIGFDPSTMQDQFKAFENFTGAPDYDPFAALIFNLVWAVSDNSWSLSHHLMYTKPEPEPPVFEEFLSFPQTFSTARVARLPDFAIEMGGSNPPGRRQLFVTGTYKNSAAMMNEFYRITQSVVEPLQAVPSIAWSLSFQPLPTIIQAVAERNGGNSLGLSTAEGPLFNVLLTATWDDSAYDVLVEGQGRRLFDEANARAKEMGVFNEYVYLNYAAPWQDPIAGYGAASKANLQKVSRKYDAKGVFQKQVPGGFKL